MRLTKVKPIEHRKPHKDDGLRTIVGKNGISLKHILAKDAQILKTAKIKL